jgi:hypothetical protein
VPFEPLTHEVAAKVVDKELGKLLTRRGLRERNTFVYAGSAVRRRAVSDAFDPRYGARTVKRWLEDKIGGSLTDLLATAPPTRMRIIRLADEAGTIVPTIEPMPERTQVGGNYVLEGALDLATARLEPAIARAAAAVANVRKSPHYIRAREEVSGELRYYVDELGQRLDALDQMFGSGKRRPTRDEDDEEHEHGVRLHQKRAPRPPASRDALIAGIAEALLIERSIHTIADPDAHAATVTVTRIGAAKGDGLIAVTQCYVHLGSQWFDNGAHADDAGEIGPINNVKGSGTFDAWQKFWRARRDCAVVLRGLFVRDAIANDHGTWMLSAAAAEPEVIRVEVRPGAAMSAADTLEQHIAARRELERAMDQGGALPRNPDVLLPVTRTITGRAPMLFWHKPYDVELEDFATGWIDRTSVKDVRSLVERCWHLAWSCT